MTSPKSSLAGCMVSFMLLLARFYLIFSCLLLIINLLSWTTPQINSESPNESEPEKLDFFSWVGIVTLLSFLILGILGVLTRNPFCLKIFAFAVIYFAVIQGFSVYGKYAERENFELELTSTLKIARTRYNWYNIDADAATSLWDIAQESFECCGLKGRSDWDSLRPGYLPPSVLPGSCCTIKSRAYSMDGLCHFKDAFKSGCIVEVHNKNNLLMLYRIMMCLNFLLQAALAFCVAIKQPTSSSSEQPNTFKYTRFEDSAYVRRPDQQVSLYNNRKPRANVSTNTVVEFCKTIESKK